jgi:hypothetical protein
MDKEYNYLQVPRYDEDVPLGPAVERIVFLHLRHDHGYTFEEAAYAIGKGHEYVVRVLGEV